MKNYQLIDKKNSINQKFYIEENEPEKILNTACFIGTF